MATLTLSACKRALLRPAFTVLLASLCACRAAPPPSLAHALSTKGDTAARAKAFMQVAVQGREAERARAAMLWGLYACDARAPLAGLAEIGRAHV